MVVRRGIAPACGIRMGLGDWGGGEKRRRGRINEKFVRLAEFVVGF